MITEYTLEEVGVMLGHPKQRIGQGGYATVFKGQWGAHSVAIKCPRDDKQETRKLFAMTVAMQRELKNWQDHPHIVQLKGFCRMPPALVYEFMEGGDLE